MTTVLDDITQILRDFNGDPQKAQSLAEFLGFNAIPSPVDQLSGPAGDELKRFLTLQPDQFGIRELYKVGTQTTRPASTGLWVAVLSNWGRRSSERDRARRRIARALTEHAQERRNLALLVPADKESPTEAELILPRASSQEQE